MDTDQISERPQKPLKAAIYARTAAPSQSGAELQDQIEACRAAAAAQGWAVTDGLVFTDNGASGLTTTRPGLQKMLETIERQPETCTVVVVSDSARLGRNFGSLAKLLSFLSNHSISVHSVEAGATVEMHGLVRCGGCRAVLEK